MLSGCDGHGSDKKQNYSSGTESTHYAVDSVLNSSSENTNSSFNGTETNAGNKTENSTVSSDTPFTSESPITDNSSTPVQENEETPPESNLTQPEQNDGVSFPILDGNSGVWDEN